MHERELQAVPELEHLRVLNEDAHEAQSLLIDSSTDVVAEACDTVRLYDLLHRSEYQAIAAVRFRRQNGESLRVYFRLLDRDE